MGDEQTEAGDDGKLTITVPQAATLIGCSRNHAYEMARAGVLPSIRLGRKLVVPRARLIAWLNGEEAGGSGSE